MFLSWLKASGITKEVSSSDPLPVTTSFGALVQKGYIQMTSLGSAIALASIPSDATYAIIQPETQGVRFRTDGTDPLAGVGMPIAAGASWTFTTRADLLALKFIEQTSAAKLNILYYG